MELEPIPTIITTVLGVLTPYVVAFINHQKWSGTSKRLVAVAASVLLTLVALGIYLLVSGEGVSDWWSFVILGVTVSQTSYALLVKGSSKAVEKSAGTGARHGS